MPQGDAASCTLGPGELATGICTPVTSVVSYDVLLIARLSINLVNDQLDTQFFYFIIRLLQSSTCFEQRRAHHQEVKLY